MEDLHIVREFRPSLLPSIVDHSEQRRKRQSRWRRIEPLGSVTGRKPATKVDVFLGCGGWQPNAVFDSTTGLCDVLATRGKANGRDVCTMFARGAGTTMAQNVTAHFHPFPPPWLPRWLPQANGQGKWMRGLSRNIVRKVQRTNNRTGAALQPDSSRDRAPVAAADVWRGHGPRRARRRGPVQCCPK
jgi:hypothetical protein